MPIYSCNNYSHCMETGPIGPPGPSVGPPGPQGITGPLGMQGVPGPEGIQGLQGPMGIQGPPGIQGIIGPQGLTGSAGPNRGLTGPTGILIHGHTGPLGITGITGSIGPTGPGTIFAYIGSLSDPISESFATTVMTPGLSNAQIPIAIIAQIPLILTVTVPSGRNQLYGFASIDYLLFNPTPPQSTIPVIPAVGTRYDSAMTLHLSIWRVTSNNTSPASLTTANQISELCSSQITINPYDFSVGNNDYRNTAILNFADNVIPGQIINYALYIGYLTGSTPANAVTNLIVTVSNNTTLASQAFIAIA